MKLANEIDKANTVDAILTEYAAGYPERCKDKRPKAMPVDVAAQLACLMLDGEEDEKMMDSLEKFFSVDG